MILVLSWLQLWRLLVLIRWPHVVGGGSRVRFRAKAPCYSADDGDTYGCHFPLGGIVMGTSRVWAPGENPSTVFGLDDGSASRRPPLGGIVVELS